MELLLSMMSGSVVLITLLGPRQNRLAASRARSLAVGERHIKHSQPGVAYRILEKLGRFLPAKRDRLDELLLSSGLAWSADALIGLKTLGAVVGLAFGFQLGFPGPVAAPLFGICGYVAPELALRRRVRTRNNAMVADLPDAVELLAVCTQAGLNIPLALRRVSDRTSGVLGDELRLTMSEIEVGIPRSRAFENLASRCAPAEVGDFVSMLLSADRFGTRLSGALEGFSSQLRARANRSAEERARKASVKMLFPLVFLVLPAFILLTVVPLLLGTFQSLGF